MKCHHGEEGPVATIGLGHTETAKMLAASGSRVACGERIPRMPDRLFIERGVHFAVASKAHCPGVASNWLTMGATLAVGVFLQPFIVHRLGDLEYGIWVLTVSSISYLVMLDMGMNASVMRYISKGYATQDHQGAPRRFRQCFGCGCRSSALILLVSGGIAALFPAGFKVPPAVGPRCAHGHAGGRGHNRDLDDVWDLQRHAVRIESLRSEELWNTTAARDPRDWSCSRLAGRSVAL